MNVLDDAKRMRSLLKKRQVAARAAASPAGSTASSVRTNGSVSPAYGAAPTTAAAPPLQPLGASMGSTRSAVSRSRGISPPPGTPPASATAGRTWVAPPPPKTTAAVSAAASATASSTAKASDSAAPTSTTSRSRGTRESRGRAAASGNAATADERARALQRELRDTNAAYRKLARREETWSKSHDEDAARILELEKGLAQANARAHAVNEDKERMKVAFEAEKTTMQQTLMELRNTLETLQRQWHDTIGTSAKQTELSIKERDAVVVYAGDLEGDLKTLKKTSGVQKLISVLAGYDRRGLATAWSKWRKELENSRLARELLHLEKARQTTVQARQKYQQKELEAIGAKREVQETRGKYDELQALLTATQSDLHVTNQQLAAARSALGASQSAEAAARGRLASIEERMSLVEGENRIMAERLRTIDRELDKREDLLRTRESRLISAENELAQKQSEVALLTTTVKATKKELQDRQEAHKGTIKTLAEVKSLNVEYEGQIAALSEAERKLMEREADLQDRLNRSFEREEALKSREAVVAEQEAKHLATVKSREKVMEARQLLLRQREEEDRAKEAEIRARLDELKDGTVLLERAVAAENHVAALESEKRALELKCDDLVSALRDRVKSGSSAATAPPGGAVAALISDRDRATETELAEREERLKRNEANVTTRLATLSSMEARIRDKEAKLDRVLANAERAQAVLNQKLAATDGGS